MNISEKIISIFAPHECLVCGKEDAPLCGGCFYEAHPGVPPRCYKCYAATPDSAVCKRCARISPLKHVWVCGVYEGYAQEMTRLFKFGRVQALAPVIARYMQETLPYLEGSLVMPVPTATSRLRQRGYDHAKLAAQNLTKSTGLTYAPLFGRLGQTRQVGTKRAQRQQQLQGALWVIKPESITGAHILLVDDVLTTGATIEEAAKVLKEAGAKQVNAVVFAQKQ